MTKENLPEEKLLKLIRGKKNEKEKPSEKTPAKATKKFESKYFFPLFSGLLILVAVGLAGFLVYRIFFEAKERTDL
ncbi:MAG: hypothetical protein NT079_03530, partial [Candidatus Omnitrophica bacterium]|nr:hypothetical protein [Candidatus Omnitrophota bacterium]